MTVELCESDLFLIEMALDQALYAISDINSPIYKKFEYIDQKIYELRVDAKMGNNHDNH